MANGETQDAQAAASLLKFFELLAEIAVIKGYPTNQFGILKGDVWLSCDAALAGLSERRW